MDFIANQKSTREKSKKKRKKEGDLTYKKSKRGAGPPKRLKSLSPPELQKEKLEKNKKITVGKIKDAKKLLETSTEAQLAASPSLTPPMAPQEGIFKLESLKPPPPPPKIAKPKLDSIQSQRSQVISELKEMFTKRGLVTR